MHDNRLQAGRSSTYVSPIESGTAKPTLRTLVQLARLPHGTAGDHGGAAWHPGEQIVAAPTGTRIVRMLLPVIMTEE
jgi:hypothetical protein